METRIKAILKELEARHGVRIIYAIESGSRVWGMASRDSDWDVRFVFVRPRQDYLRLDRKRETIEHIEGKTDFVGFDIYKFFGLLRESNPTVIEWLVSSKVYRNTFKGWKELRAFVQAKFNPLGLFHHYKSMCKQNYLKYIRSGADVRYKRYLYCLRGMVNALYVLKKGRMPPIDLARALGILDKRTASRVRELVRLKRAGLEKEKTARIKTLDKEIEAFIESKDQPEPRKLQALEFFNKILFRNI